LVRNVRIVRLISLNIKLLPYPVLAQLVIRANAGIQIFIFCRALDAHFRGHDIFFQIEPLLNY